MSIKIGHIVVQSENFEEVGEVTKVHLDHWFKNVYLTADLPQRIRSPENFFLDDEGIRSLIVLPPVNGWTIILERVQARADLDLAKALSEKLKVKTIVAEVDGTRYRWADLTYENGALADATLEPPDAFGAYYRKRIGEGAEWGDRAEMPMYTDAEKGAFEALVAQGVPTDLIFLCHDDVSAGIEMASSQAMFFKIWERSDGPAFRHYLFSARFEPAVEDGKPPLRNDHVELKTEVSQQRLEEQRFVYGEPTEEAVRNLVDLEDKFRQRIFDQSSQDCIDEYLPEVEFTYFHEASDERFSRMLRSAQAAKRVEKRALYHRAIFGRYGFNNRAADILRTAFPDYEFTETDEFVLKFGRKDSRDVQPWPLEELYQKYLRNPERLNALVREEFQKLSGVDPTG